MHLVCHSLRNGNIMSLSDCVKCWNTPCTCGYEYRNWTKIARIEQAAIILGVDKGALTILFGCFVPEKHPQCDLKDNNKL